MELSTYLNMMRDPAGLPFYPIVFQALLVFTFALHITMINLVAGAIFVAITEIGKRSEFGIRLAKAMGRVITVGFSVAIVLGVAPLLFVQVIYDPYWYTATTMSAFWAMLFLALVTAAFYAGYGFYLGNKDSAPATGRDGMAWLAALMVIAAGLIIHMLSMEQLLSGHWKEWVVSEGTVSFAGGEFHGVSFGRFAHFILSSGAVIGVFMMLYAWYFRDRADYEPDYLDYVGRQGVKIAVWSTLASVGAGFWWFGTVPEEFMFARNPFFLAGAIMGVCALIYIAGSAARPAERAVPSAIFLFLTILVMCCAREGLRMDYAGAAGYSIFDYKLNVDWPSTILFFATFVMGLVVLWFPAVAAYKAGQAKPGEVVELDPRLGKMAVGLLIGWFAVVAGLGIVVSLKNGMLF